MKIKFNTTVLHVFLHYLNGNFSFVLVSPSVQCVSRVKHFIQIVCFLKFFALIIIGYISLTHLVSAADLPAAILNFYNSCKGNVASVVKVVCYSQTVTVSCKIIPLININTIYFICHNLKMVSIIRVVAIINNTSYI